MQISTDARIEPRLRSLGRMIGNTPMLAIEFTLRGRARVLHAKAEHFNLTGSIKDRMALHILRSAYAEGRVATGDTIAEATSGNSAALISSSGSPPRGRRRGGPPAYAAARLPGDVPDPGEPRHGPGETECRDREERHMLQLGGRDFGGECPPRMGVRASLRSGADRDRELDQSDRL